MSTKKWMRAGVIIAACVAALTFAADEPKSAEDAGDAAWAETIKFFRPPPPPAEWQIKEPTKEQLAEHERKNGVLAGTAADKVREFYTKFPAHPKAKDAQAMELKLLDVAVQLGSTNRRPQLLALEDKRLGDPSVPSEEKFMLRAQRIIKLLNDESTNRAPLLAQAEKAVRALQADFPKREESHDLWMMIAQDHLRTDALQSTLQAKKLVVSGEVQRARSIAADVAKQATGETKDDAEALLKKLDRLGQPLEVEFKDLNDKDAGTKKAAGKVLLVDFWATWCGPCRAALPEVKETYARLHAKGFEIVGISFDKEKDDLTKVIAEEKIPWPQYFDGLFWDNKIGRKFGISSLPSMWLVDKKGNLRDLQADHALAEKIEKLLAEE